MSNDELSMLTSVVLRAEVTIAACAPLWGAMTAFFLCGQIKTHTWCSPLTDRMQNLLCDSLGAALFHQAAMEALQI